MLQNDKLMPFTTNSCFAYCLVTVGSKSKSIILARLCVHDEQKAALLLNQ